MAGRVDGKVAVVTGGAQGIGRATVQALAREGARVVIGDIDDAAGDAAQRVVVAAGGTALYQRADVGSTGDMARLIETAVSTFGRLDVLVNNAAVALPGSVTEIDEETWQRVLNINLTGVWRGMKFAIPHMIEAGGGSIINVSSVQSLLGFAGWSAYAAAKGGINALTQQAAIDYAPHNIRVNAIAPGTIMTPMNERIFRESDDPDALIHSWNELHALGRFGQPHEVSALIVFLASDESSFMTGDVIRVDGGAVIKGG
ncbi:MAG: SDR family NAD(P)-dependent oxidoreductase [Aggregatilineales bacterium]